MRIAILAALLLVTAWTYAPAWSAESVYEDDQSLSVSVSQLKNPITPLTLFKGRSFTTWTFALVKSLGGDVRAQHAVNLSLHLVNGILLFWWLERLKLPLFAVTSGVALWLLHPMAVESVAYISARTELCAAFGVLLSLCGLHCDGWRGWTLVAVGLVLALTAKESAIVSVLLVGLSALVSGRMSRRTALIAAGVGFVYAGSRWWMALGERTLWQADRHGLGYAATQATIVWAFLWKTLMPWGASFTVDHDWFWVTPAVGIPALIAFLMALVACACFARRAPRLALACAWPLLAVFPRLIVRLPEWLNEHQWYVPLVGCAWLTAELVSRWKTLITLTPAQYAALDVEDD